MVEFIEYLLEKQEIRNQQRFNIIKDMILLCGKGNNFEVTDKDIINIAKLTFDFKIEKSDIDYGNFIENLVNFFLKVVYYYENGKFDRFNYLLQLEKSTNNSLKNWIKEHKTSIFNACEYYLGDSLNEKREMVLSNDYFEIIKLYKTKTDEWGTPKENNDSIEVRIPLKGELYYKNGVFLKEREYLLSGPQAKLERYKLLTDEILLLIIKIKPDFINKLKVKELTDIKHMALTIDEKNMRSLTKQTMFVKDFSFFIDTIITLLKINGLVETDIISVSLVLSNEDEIRDIFKIIERNIALPEDEIKEKILKKYKYGDKKIDEIIYKATKLTLKKYILKEKTRYIMEEYRNNFRITFEELVEKYHYSNMKNLRYNMKNFYEISIKDVKHIKPER